MNKVQAYQVYTAIVISAPASYPRVWLNTVSSNGKNINDHNTNSRNRAVCPFRKYLRRSPRSPAAVQRTRILVTHASSRSSRTLGFFRNARENGARYKSLLRYGVRAHFLSFSAPASPPPPPPPPPPPSLSSASFASSSCYINALVI